MIAKKSDLRFRAPAAGGDVLRSLLDGFVFVLPVVGRFARSRRRRAARTSIKFALNNVLGLSSARDSSPSFQKNTYSKVARARYAPAASISGTSKTSSGGPAAASTWGPTTLAQAAWGAEWR